MVPLIGPTAANIDYTEKYSKELMPIYNNIPEKQDYLLVNGAGMKSASTPNAGMSVLFLKPWSQRKRSVDKIIASIFPPIWSITGIKAFPINPPNLPGVSGKGAPIQMQLQTIGDYNRLHEIALQMTKAAQANHYLVNLDNNPKLDQPQLDIKINRNRAGDMGISINEIGTAINVALGQPKVCHFSMDGRSYDVIPQLYHNLSGNPDALNELYLRAIDNKLVPLSNLVTINETIEPQSIDHFQQLRTVTVEASVLPGYTIGQGIEYFQGLAKKIVPSDIQVDWGGMSRQYMQTSGQMTTTFIFAVIFIFLVLAAQFESFRDPFIVLFTIPLSTFGALLAMFLAGCTMNIYSEIGLVTLVGLISKHGILMVEFANQLQEKGQSVVDAIITAASVRLRPILMTTSHGARSCAACICARRWCCESPTNWVGNCWWNVDWHYIYSICCSNDVYIFGYKEAKDARCYR